MKHSVTPRRTCLLPALVFWIWAAPACLPFAGDNAFGWATSAAHSESGKGKDGNGGHDDSGGGNSGHGDGSHDDGGSGDSGSGNGNGEGSHDDGNDDGPDDHGTGQGNGSDDSDQREASTSPKPNVTAIGGSLASNTLHLRYSNGWDERVVRGRYWLTDPKGRVVKEREARPDDLVRMRAQLGQ